MKYWHCIAIILLLLLLIILAIDIALAQAPEVTTNDATDVTSDSATLNGNLTSLGDYSWAYVSFEWGGNTTYGTETTPGNITTGPFSDNINSLSPNTTYHFRAKAVGNGTVTVYGNDATFTTIALTQAPPEVNTNGATDITSDSATLNGNLTSLGNASSVDVWFQYATDAFYTSNGNTYSNSTPPQTMSIAAPFSSPISSLSPDTTYHFMAMAMAGNYTANGNDTTFTTAESFNLQGWGWCTDQTKVTTVTFEGYTTMVERTSASNSYSMHAVGNLTLQQPYNETITLDMYGSRVRSLFYLREEITGKSASFQGTWLDTSGNQSYIATGGVIGLPNPDGQVLKTARLCFVYLRTPDVEVPLTEPGSFVQDMESLLTRFVKLIDRVVDSLIGTGFSDILSNILTKIAVLLAYLRALGTPYIT